jgi:hypothetical protein
MVKYRERSDMTGMLYTDIYPRDPGPEVCRLCKVAIKQLATREQQLATEGPDLNPTDWKKAQLNMS